MIMIGEQDPQSNWYSCNFLRPNRKPEFRQRTIHVTNHNAARMYRKPVYLR